MSTYTVTWTMIYEADDPMDAVSQAVTDLETITRYPGEGPNYLSVCDEHGSVTHIMTDEVLSNPNA